MLDTKILHLPLHMHNLPHYQYIPLSDVLWLIYPFTYEHLSSLLLWAIMNEAAINICACFCVDIKFTAPIFKIANIWKQLIQERAKIG